MRRFILDLFLAALLGLAVGIFLEIKELEKENKRLNEDIKQIEWVKCAKELNPQNKYFYMGVENGNK